MVFPLRLGERNSNDFSDVFDIFLEQGVRLLLSAVRSTRRFAWRTRLPIVVLCACAIDR